MKITESKTRTKYPLSKRKIIKKTLSGTILLFILAFVGIVAATIGRAVITTDPTVPAEAKLFLPLLSYAWLIILVLFFVLTAGYYIYQKWYFAVYYYELEKDYISIRKGPITPTEINVPFERIQDVYVDQDLLDRIFGLYDVHLSTATITSGMEAHIDGLQKEAAMALRDELLAIVKEKIHKAKGRK